MAQSVQIKCRRKDIKVLGWFNLFHTDNQHCIIHDKNFCNECRKIVKIDFYDMLGKKSFGGPHCSWCLLGKYTHQGHIEANGGKHKFYDIDIGGWVD